MGRDPPPEIGEIIRFNPVFDFDVENATTRTYNIWKFNQQIRMIVDSLLLLEMKWLANFPLVMN